MNNNVLKKKVKDLTDKIKRRDKVISQNKILVENLMAEKQELENLND